MSKYDELKWLAEAATKGPWHCSDKPHGEWWHIGSEYTLSGKKCANGRQAIATACAANKKSNPAYAAMFEANARFIAAANPSVVLELVAEAQKRPSWQPMETCPRHVDVLFYRKDAGVFSGRLTDADSFMTDKERDELELSEEEQYGLDAWSYEPEGVYRLDGDLVPTHWMPMPDEPEIQEASQ